MTGQLKGLEPHDVVRWVGLTAQYLMCGVALEAKEVNGRLAA